MKMLYLKEDSFYFPDFSACEHTTSEVTLILPTEAICKYVLTFESAYMKAEQ